VLANCRSDQVGLSALASRRSLRVAAKSRMKNPPITYGTMNMASWLPLNSWTTNVPVTDAIGMQTPRTPATTPRWVVGIWSGSARRVPLEAV